MERFYKKERPAPKKKRYDPLPLYEIHGRMQPSFSQRAVWSLLKSYGQVRILSLSHHIPVPTFMADMAFNSEGTFFACAESFGRLMVYDYESFAAGQEVDFITCFDVGTRIQAVKWIDETKVACVKGPSNKIYCYDFLEMSQTPGEVYETGASVRYYDLLIRNDKLFACGSGNGVTMWDRRKGRTSTYVLDSPFHGLYRTMDMSLDEQVLYAGSATGHLIAWDLRGGRKTPAFSSPNRVHHPPLAVLKLSDAMNEIPELKNQIGEIAADVTCLSVNPASGNQLAFALNSGWSGVLDIFTFQNITHMHCPPPPTDCWSSNYTTKLAWLLNLPVAAVANSSRREVYFLDFTPGPGRSQHHVQGAAAKSNILPTPVALETSQEVSCVAVHPSEGDILAGNKKYIHLFGQPKRSVQHDDSQ